MKKRCSESGTILVTGGTSGLGLELVRLFLEKGYFVIATGRQSVSLESCGERLRFYIVDFSNLGQTASVIRQICENFELDVIVNNAGILSPPGFTATDDGYEYTYQVNFLAHLLVNEIIIRQHDYSRPLKIAAVTSLAYRVLAPELNASGYYSDYKPFRAYSDSKLYLALMCRHFSVKYQDREISAISFDPGVFGSRIYRMQPGWFRILYHIGALFLRSPASSARVLAELLTGSGFVNGVVYDVRKKIRKLPEIEPSSEKTFWKETGRKIEPFL